MRKPLSCRVHATADFDNVCRIPLSCPHLWYASQGLFGSLSGVLIKPHGLGHAKRRRLPAPRWHPTRHSHRASAWPLRASPPRSLGLSRAPLLFRVARRQDSLQTNCHRRPLGSLATCTQHAGLHAVLRPPRQAALRRASLSRLLLRCTCPLDLLFLLPVVHHQRGRRKPAAYHQGVFPRLILPISSALSGLVDFAIGFAVLSVFCFAYGIRPTLAALWLPILLLLALFTALGVGLWLSALNALYRDVRYVMPFIVQFWMFASPVAYPSSLVPARWRWLYGLNP